MVKSKARVKAVFFDLYHTLVGYRPPREEYMAKAINGFGIKITQESLRRPLAIADEFINQEHARLRLSQRTDDDKKKMWARYQEIALKEAGIEPTRELTGNLLGKMQQIKLDTVLFDDVLPVLAKLKNRGLILGLISNMDSDITPLCRKLGLIPLLQIVVTSQTSGYTKPEAEIFKAAAKEAGVKTSEAVFVGDQYQIDVLGANGAGMQGILIDRNGISTDASRGPRIRSLNELEKYLK
jgi:putative hydrolase of the HAD superfamily